VVSDCIKSTAAASVTVRDEPNYYISAFAAKRNPDLLIPGGPIKGNAYKRNLVDLAKTNEDSAKEEEEDKGVPEEDSAASVGEDHFSKLQH